MQASTTCRNAREQHLKTLDAIREFYADRLSELSGWGDDRLKSAFLAVRREEFLGPGPWTVPVGGGKYIRTPTADPALLYQDILVGLKPGDGINNGEPGLHARFISAVSPQLGETVLHVGCGGGYYTAILAELVGPNGTVDAFEIDPDLARAATGNLSERQNVTIHARSGAEAPLPESDVIYVNAGVTRPLDIWLDAMKPAGRMVVPMAPARGLGVSFVITRLDLGYSAKFVWRTAIIPCVCARDEAEDEHLSQALRGVGFFRVRSLKRAETPPDTSCWLAWDGGWFSTEDQ